MTTTRKPRPRNALPVLESGQSRQHPPPRRPYDNQLVLFLRAGARIMVDIATRQAVLYSFSGGFKKIKTLTVRVVSRLLSCGDIALMASQNGVLHFSAQSGSPSWYRAEPFHESPLPG